MQNRIILINLATLLLYYCVFRVVIDINGLKEASCVEWQLDTVNIPVCYTAYNRLTIDIKF